MRQHATVESTSPLPETVAVEASPVLPAHAGRQLDSALAANRRWRKWRREFLERKIRKVRKRYSLLAYPMGASAVWIGGWLVDQLFFGGANLSWGRPQAPPGSPEREFANAFIFWLTMGQLVAGAVVSAMMILWEESLRQELVSMSDEDRD